MINIVYTVNDNFVPQLATGICSVCENNKSEEVCFYVISYGITEANKEKLKKYVASYGKKIEIIELGNLEDYIDFEFDTSGWNPIVLARLVLTELLPDDVEKVLYLDGDTMVRASLKELWEMDMHGKVIGAVVEPTANHSRKAVINLREEEPYCNAGVLLIDMVRWKETRADKRVLEFYKKYDGKLFANDQDAINGALKEDIIWLPIEYNFCNSYRFYPYKTLKKIMSPCKFVDYSDYQKAMNNPVIIHFLGEERPWRIGNKNPFTPEYLQYWSKTPWKDSNLETGWKKYFVAFNAFNVIMKIAPYCRYKIIDKMIPWVLEHRGKKK